MEIRKIKIEELRPAEYNPRKDLQPGDREYKKLKASLEEFGYVEPIVWNERTGNVVGGHQRLKVLKEHGQEEVEAVVINVDETEEKILNVSLNQIKGRWDIDALAGLLDELNTEGLMELTGFEEWELKNITEDFDHIQDLFDEDFAGSSEPGPQSELFTVTFTFRAEDREEIEDWLEYNEDGKQMLEEELVRKIEEEVC